MKWDFESVKAKANEFSSKRAFEDAYSGAVAWARRHRCYEDVTSHMDKATIWNKSLVLDAAKKCKTRSEFTKRFSGARKYAERFGFIDECFKHMKSNLWTEDRVREEAKKYSSRGEMHSSNPSAAQAASRMGIMDQLFEHKLTIWDFESAKKEALKYKTREEFRFMSGGASQWACRNNVFDDICQHMSSDSYHDNDAIYIWKAKDAENLYKIGVTSKRLGSKRIKQVSSDAGIDIEFFIMVPFDNALKIEKEMLKLGKRFEFDCVFDGVTEFRILSDNEFNMCLSLMGLSKSEILA